MLIQATKPLFPWDELEISPTLATIKDALQAIPDSPLLDALRQRRHNGCGTYPVSVLWGVLLLSIILRHTTTPSAGHSHVPPSCGLCTNARTAELIAESKGT